MERIDRLFTGFRIASTGLRAERTRMDVIADNIANARTSRTPEGGPYRRKLVLFEPILKRMQEGRNVTDGVRVLDVVEDFAHPMERTFDPGHPDADADGFVMFPNVNAVMEMADLITAMRAYEANLTVKESFLRMAERALQLAR